MTAQTEDPVDDRYNIDCTKGMHLLKTAFKKAYLARQCEQLLEGLEQAIAATLECAPVRRNSDYFVDRDGGAPSVRSTETLWERALWEHFRDPLSAPAVPGAWYRLVMYQVPLRNTHHDIRWGSIDLLGVSHQGLPVVVELKQPGAHEVTPAEMVVQAAAYALALRKSWDEDFGRQWHALISTRYGFRPPPWNGAAPMIHLVGAAPREYWHHWLGNSPKARTVSPQVWPQMSALVTALGERGLPATFVEIGHEGLNAENSPRNLTCRVLDPFVRTP